MNQHHTMICHSNFKTYSTMKTTKTTELFAQALQQLHAVEQSATDAMCAHFIDEGHTENASELAGNWVMTHLGQAIERVADILKEEIAERIDAHALNSVCDGTQEFAL